MKSKKIINLTVLASMTVSTVAGSSVASATENKFDSVSETVTSEKRNVMYYSDWSIWGGQDNFYPKDLPADQITHLNFAFLDFDGNGNLVFTDKDAAVGAPVGQTGVGWGDPNAGILMALQELRQENPNMKLGVSVGGWSRSGDFSEVAADPEKRAFFVDNLMKYLEYTNMDYLDIDWEYPNFVRVGDSVDLAGDEGTPNAKPEDKENYVLLLSDIREAMDEQGERLGKTYELSIALPVGKEKIDLGLDIDGIFDVIDFANVMSYDMRGAWDEFSGHQTPLYPNPEDPINNESGRLLSIDETVDYLIELGAPSDKIVIGVAQYSRGWDQVDAGDNEDLPGLFQQAHLTNKDADGTPSYGADNDVPIKAGEGGRAAGVWAYRNFDELKTQYKGLDEYWDDTAKAPYMYDEDTGAFFTYDNEQSINEKGSYVLEHDLGGMIGWQASNDAVIPGTTVRGELTTVTKEAMYGEADLPDHEIVYSDLDVTVTITPYKEAWGANPNGFEITVTNNEKLEETDDVLSELEVGAETIKAPKFYIKSDSAFTSGGYGSGTITQENGYTVVDLSSVWEAKNIEPGQSYTFKLKGESEIESIELVQRMSTDGPDMYRQTVYGTAIEGEAQNQAPTFIGLANKTITVGTEFDPLAGVSATDVEDGNLTSKIEVSGTVDTQKAGIYTLTYTVTDSEGLKSTRNRVITVKEEAVVENSAPTLSGVSNKTITVGEYFNPLDGVSAYDAEDGDLTLDIAVAGLVDTQKVGTYTLTYAVADHEGVVTKKERVITVVAKNESTYDFGVGQGIVWPEQVFAPYVDMVSWVTKPGYANNGAANLGRLMEDTTITHFNLGFIQATGGVSDGAVNWGWGGHAVLSEDHADNAQYKGIKQSITDVREAGGDVTISLGGLTGTAIWEVSQDVDVLTKTYMEIVEGYGLTRLDLDIEGAAQNKAHNIENAKAIKNVQDATGVAITLTVPVLPSGLTHTQLDVLEAYLSAGVEIELVNIMTMCYGNGTLLPGENYGTASLRAVESTKDQLQDYFKKFADITLSDEEAFMKIGTTISAGFEGAAHPIFTTEWAELVVEHAIENNLGMVSFWSLNRDAMLENNQGINSQYEFTERFKAFTEAVGHDTEGEDDRDEDKTPTPQPEENSAPVISGATNSTIIVGDNFNQLAGVTATDKEDGVITNNIQVSGTVNTQKIGSYTLTYTITDSKGLTTTVTRIVTVIAQPNTAPVISGVNDVSINIGDSFDPKASVLVFDKEDGTITSRLQITGTVDTQTAGKYVLTYTVTDSQGLTSTVIRTVTVVDPFGDTFDLSKVYNTGDKVVYNGEIYTAKWWVQGTYPDQSAAWEKEIKANEDGSINYESGLVFNSGDIVKYQGKTYHANWWTMSTPGSDASWTRLDGGDESGDSSTPDYKPGGIYTEGMTCTFNGKTYKANWWTTSIPGSDASWTLIN